MFEEIKRVSGSYESTSDASEISREELRLDVDGDFPQMVASGTGFSGLTFRMHWIARPLTAEPTKAGSRWTGPIVVKQGSSDVFPFTHVAIEVTGSCARVTFSGEGMPDRVRDLGRVSPFFREVLLEYDAEQNVDLVLDYDTGSHPDRPASLPLETLTIDSVFERSGFQVLRGVDTIVPSSASGSDASWSDTEMHDAMQVHFSTLASLPPSQRNRARWALWTFFAGIHDDGEGLGGIMFDTIGAAERQGTALFLRSFISDPPLNDPAPDAWVRRMTFWTAVHEMGHAFNLLHAWQKTLGVPWLPQVDSFDLQSFMNYPFFYQFGPPSSNSNTIRFFRDFLFRFSDDELFFLRHAPESFVQMGGTNFGVQHAFEQARVSPDPDLVLELRTHRAGNEYEFLEPVMIELKLTNHGSQPRLVDERLLEHDERMSVVLRRPGGTRTAYRPFARKCYQPQARTLAPQESMYTPLFLSVGVEGWMIDEPGWYEIQICLHLEHEDIVSNTLRVRVAPPLGREEEYLAQDFFSEDVGRALTFDGSHFMTKANDVLGETSERLAGRKVSIHADVALQMPKTRAFKLLTKTEEGPEIREVPAEEGAAEQLAETLGSSRDQSDRASEALGHIDYHYYVDHATEALEQMERPALGVDVLQNMYETFKERKVLPSVLKDIRKTIRETEKKAGKG